MEPRGGHRQPDQALPLPFSGAQTDHCRGLHVCGACASDLVQPQSWTETEAGHWWIELRCPECEHRHEGVYSQPLLDAFDEQLNADTDALMGSYRRLVRENLADEVERFTDALHAGAILPEDF